MKCEYCKNQDATVHIVEIVGENRRSWHACEACAKDHSVIDTERLLKEAGLENLLPMALPELIQDVPEEVHEEPEVMCQHCGLTLSEFKAGGNFGCRHDYELFQNEVDQRLMRTQSASTHRGRGPARVIRQIEHAAREKELLDALDQAVRKEEFEEAATLRDQLQKHRQEASGAPGRE